MPRYSWSMEVATVQRRTLRLLFVTQIISGIGVAVGASVGALLAADIAGIGVSGLAQSAIVVGAALFALPATAIVYRHGRRPSLAAGYVVAALGSIIVVGAAVRGSIPLLFLGFFLFGGATTAGLQARYAAVDLVPVALRGRHLSLIVWATTLGAVLGPSLAPAAGATLDGYGVPILAGPFAFSALLFGLATLLLLLLLRPDPAVVARGVAGNPSARSSDTPGMRAALRFVVSHAPARLGVSSMAIGNLVMIGVMAMTPVHIRSAGHGAPQTLSIVGLVLSFHIAGMFAFSPVVGWLTDRLGRRPVIVAGIALLLTACGMAGSAGHEPARLAAALMVLGLGWSATMVSGSTLLSDSIATELRASAQGLSDLVMGLAGASAGAVSGAIVDAWGYPTLTLLAAFAAVPLIVLLALPAKRLDDTAGPGQATPVAFPD
ncbi:MAG TPA: MFS transporter [Gemmatimonadales bacterium]|nr:MFS transporter [Gemmatimonadales bacterium]